jgi:O-antigen ligase
MRIDPGMHPPRNFLVMLGFAVIFCLGFVVKSSATSVALALSMVVLFELRDPKVRELWFALWRTHKPWIGGLIVLPLLIAVRELFVEVPHARYLDSASRQILAIPLFMLAAQLPVAMIAKIRWAWLAAPVLMLAAGMLFADQRIRTEFTNTIPFSAFALMFGVLIWIASEDLSPRLRALCWSGVVSAAVIVFLSASRGVWLAVPFAVFMGLKVRSGQEIRKFFLVMGVFILLAILFYFVSPWVKWRIDASVSNYLDFLSGDKGSDSIGMRLQMAWSSWHIFLDNPWFGVGRNIIPVMSELYDKGLITASVREMADTHGEIFYNMASLGVFGIVATVWFYVGVSIPFWRARRSGDNRVARIGRMGLSCNAIFSSPVLRTSPWGWRCMRQFSRQPRRFSWPGSTCCNKQAFSHLIHVKKFGQRARQGAFQNDQSSREKARPVRVDQPVSIMSLSRPVPDPYPDQLRCW